MPLLHVRRFLPSLSPTLSSVRRKVCSNHQHHCHLARSRSAADVVPLLPTAGRHWREPPRCASSRRSSCASVCLHEPSWGAPPLERNDERPPSSSVAGHSTAGGPLWSSSGLAFASASSTLARSTSASMQTPTSTLPMDPHWRAPTAEPHRYGERYSGEPLPSPAHRIRPHLVVVFPDPLAHRLSPSESMTPPLPKLPGSLALGSGLPAHGQLVSRLGLAKYGPGAQ
jgi:hypothetical protein